MKKWFLLLVLLLAAFFCFGCSVDSDGDANVDPVAGQETSLINLSEEELHELFETAYGGYETVEAPLEEKLELELIYLKDLAYAGGYALPEDYENLYKTWRPVE